VKLVFSSLFEQDFAELVTRFATEASTEVATRFEENTCAVVKLLLHHPELGRLRRDLSPRGIRSFRVRGFDRYLLFYQIRSDELVWLRLRYGGMNLQTFFLSRD
jgi:plasmid stabilization system protein ParE